jgi:hypothetical protein
MCLFCRIYAAKLKAFKNGGSDVNVKILSVAAVMAWCVGSAHADVYRCTGADGKTVYQQSPCATGAQKTVDDSNSRFEARQRQILEAQKREASGELEKHAKLLRACLEDKICEADSYPLFLRGKPRSFVNDVLGDPASVQNIGGREIHYFNVPTTDGRKRAKIQLSYKNFAVESVNVY